MRGYLRLSGVRSRCGAAAEGAHAAVFAVKVRAASVASVVRLPQRLRRTCKASSTFSVQLGQQKDLFEAMHAEATQVTRGAIFPLSLNSAPHDLRQAFNFVRE